VLKNGAFADERLRERIAAEFSPYGVEAARLDLRVASPHAQMLAEYGDVDIALDPFPFNGGLTTCEALWMGVPVLTLAADTMIARQGETLLKAAGMDAWIAHDEETFASRAIEAAADVPTLAEKRRGLRAELRASPLLDARIFAVRFGAMVEAIIGIRQA